LETQTATNLPLETFKTVLEVLIARCRGRIQTPGGTKAAQKNDEKRFSSFPIVCLLASSEQHLRNQIPVRVNPSGI
jgi:hypothetical protein